MGKITFSIVTPTWNRLDTGFLGECIDSVKNQVTGDFEYEHIIVNDGSTDKTGEYLSQISQVQNNIRVFTQKNSGSAKAIQRGIKEAKGEYIIILDDDDMLPRDSLKTRAEFIENNKGIDWFYGKALWIDDLGKNIPPVFQSQFYNDFMYERMLINNIIHSGTPTTRSSILKKIVWPDWLERSQDYFLWLELLRPGLGLKYAFLDKYIFTYRVHNQSYTSEYVGNKSKLMEKIRLNDKVKALHPQNLVFLANQARDAALEISELRIIKSYYDQAVIDLDKKDELIEQIMNSKSWKAAEKIRKMMRKK